MVKSNDNRPALKARSISVMAPRSTASERLDGQGVLNLQVERDVDGVGMGILSDGTPYLNQRGLAVLCGVQNAHIGTISNQWAELDQKPRLLAIKAILQKTSETPSSAHVEIKHKGKTHYCYPADVCLAILEYYAFDAGTNCQHEARDNFRKLAGSKLKELIYSQLGYDSVGYRLDAFEPWHDRIALNHKAAPKGYFSVFNEANTLIYELINAGASVGDEFVPDISIGQIWSRYWTENTLESEFGERVRYSHNYPDSHPQADSNPQECWSYPNSCLGVYREWLQDEYVEGGKLRTYLKGKVARHELTASVANKALDVLVPLKISA